MKDLLQLSVRKFLEERGARGKCLLLGYSGGPDSKALLYLLNAIRPVLSFELHLAHVDHGWREESKREAEKIQEEAKALGLTLHLQTLKAEDFLPGNLEKQGREHRFRFFGDVITRIGCDALLLGHHADDQAEVVLKRVFEGASISSMGGLASESLMRGMHLWRPLLGWRKKALLEWLSRNQLDYFLDATNADSRFLRGRMRTHLFPLLTEGFGKEIASSLCRLGEESRQIQSYFSRLNRPILSCVRKSDAGELLDLNPFLPLPQIQINYLLREWLGRERGVFSRQIFDQIALAVEEGGAEKKFLSGGSEIQVTKGIIRLII